jgi:hypothetical protein
LKWSFYWHDELLTLRLDLMGGGGGRGEPGWSHWKLVMVNGSYGLPEHFRAYQSQFIADLKEALTAYKDFGAYSSNTNYSIVLDLDAECVL